LKLRLRGFVPRALGCFFDDPMHETFGLRDKQFQSIYHFTMGGPVEDDRLTTDPPYHESFDRIARSRVLIPDLP
jgi:hypothetical protein